MITKSFFALVTDEISENKFISSVKQRSTSELQNNDVLIKVHFSSLNFKDALSAKGHKGITKKYPHTPGVDAAGEIEESNNPNFKVGDRIIVTGYELGMNTDGGFGQYIRVPSNWIVKLPDDISFKEIMYYGTAGYTACICIYEIIRNEILPETGKILVTGATGGVGSIAVSFLNKLGYHVVASTGKLEQKEFLTNLGAKEILSRDEVNDKSNKALLQKRWAAVIDNVGGNTLTTSLKSTLHRAVVCSVGLVEADTFASSVYPFLLRGVRLIGIDSAESPMDYRLKIWNKIFNELRINNYEDFSKEIGLNSLNEEIDKILSGKQVGKVILNLFK